MSGLPGSLDNLLQDYPMNDEPEQSAKSDNGNGGTIPFKKFLEAVHPSVEKQVSGLWRRVSSHMGPHIETVVPALRLHCQRCDGERVFRSKSSLHLKQDAANAGFVTYVCGNCHEQVKWFSLWIAVGQEDGVGTVYKYGEKPPFGVTIHIPP